MAERRQDETSPCLTHRGTGTPRSEFAERRRGQSGGYAQRSVERENAVKGLREVMGATNPANAAEGTVRKKFAENIERNCIHGSDAPETAEQELRYFFTTAELI